jgi:hypothetical protein
MVRWGPHWALLAKLTRRVLRSILEILAQALHDEG